MKWTPTGLPRSSKCTGYFFINSAQRCASSKLVPAAKARKSEAASKTTHLFRASDSCYADVQCAQPFFSFFIFITHVAAVFLTGPYSLQVQTAFNTCAMNVSFMAKHKAMF